MNTVPAGTGAADRKRSQRMWLSPARRFMVDLLRFSKKVPSQALSRECCIPQLPELRRGATPRIGWLAIMIRAYSRVVMDRPWMKRTFLKWPLEHLYEHRCQTCRFAVVREAEGEDRVFFARIREPEQLSLREIQRQIDEFRLQPVSDVPTFRRQQTMSRLPAPLRRLIWWLGLNVWPAFRVYLTGTFGLTTVSSHKAVSLHPPSLGQLVLAYGPISDDGEFQLTFVYDHRVFDGGQVAECMAAFEAELNGAVAAELDQLNPESSEPGIIRLAA